MLLQHLCFTHPLLRLVTEASYKEASQAKDSVGIRTLPNTEIYEQLCSYGGEGSTVPVESHHTPTSAPSTSQPPTSPPSMQTTHVAEEAATMPHDSPLPRVHSLGSDEGIIIMAQRQQAADVHQDDLCPPNKRYDLMDANKKVDLENFWHTLKEDGSRNRFKFLLDRKELALTLDDFRTIFHLPQANDNNHASVVQPLSFSDMVSFYKQVLGFTMELKSVSNFKIPGLLQPWQTLCKIFSKCLTTRDTGWDQPTLQIMKMLYCFVNNIHVDYAKLMWEGIYYSLHHPATSILYPRFMKIIIRRNKNKVGMRIPAWMITDEMKLMENYKMQFARQTPPVHVPTAEKADEMILQDTIQVSLAEHKSHEEQETRENVALVDEHLTSEEIEKLIENPENVDDSLPPRHDDTSIPDTRLEPRSDKESPEVGIVQEKMEETRKTTEVEPDIVIPVNVDDEEEEIIDEVFKLKRRVKGKNVEESRISTIHSLTRSPRNFSTLVSSDTEKLQELTVTHPTPSSGSVAPKLTKTNRLLSLIKAKPNRFKRYKTFFHELQGRYGYFFAHLKKRFMPWTSSDQLADNLHDVMMETLPSLVKEKVTEQVKKEVPAQVRDQVPVYLAKGLILERKTTTEETERLISKAILNERGRMQEQISSQIQNAIDNAIPSLVDASVRSYMSGHILHVHPAQVQSSSVPEQQHQLYLAMKADPLLQQQDIAIWLALRMKFEQTQVQQTPCRPSAIRTRDQDDPHDDAHPEGENSAKRQKTSEYEAYVSGESSSGQDNAEEPGPSTSGNQEQDDEFDFWTKSYASDDDEIPTKQVSQDIMKEISLTIDEAKLKKMTDEMLRQRCTLGDEHQYHIDQMKNFLQNDIIWESRKEILKGNSGPEKIVLSLHKFPAIVFDDDDIEERTSRWVNKRQKEPGRPKEEIYSNSKIVQVIKTFWELGHEHKFITEIVARRANGCIVSITEPDYKNLNKNDIEDMYLLIMNNKKINLTAPTITFPRIEEYDVFSIVYEPVHGIIYTNIKKEKLDESRFILDANLLRKAFEITPIDQAHQFVSPPSGKTSGFDRTRYPVLQVLWGIITSTNVDYAEIMWEEFVQAMQTFLVDKDNLSIAPQKGKKTKPHVIPYCRFTTLIICHLGRTHSIHQRSASLFHLAEEDIGRNITIFNLYILFIFW
ncbi:hypothetical protein Tco_0500495 [Tanacetum coccineum]